MHAARPHTEAELSSLLHGAHALGRPVHTFGSASKAHWGPGPAAACQAICLRNLAGLELYEPGDMVVRAQAGLMVKELQAALADRGQWWPVDSAHADATVGGVLATRASGPRRLGYGPVRDGVVGMRVADATGVITQSGGRVVKNVTGFDLARLHVGAMGTLGVIVEAHLKVAARPPARAIFLSPFESREAAHRSLWAVWASALRPVALEVVAGDAAAAFARGLHDTAALPLAPAYALVGVEGTPDLINRHRRDLPVVSESLRQMEMRLDAQADQVWAALAQVEGEPRNRLSLRVGTPPHDLAAVLARLAPNVDVTVHVGLGTADLGLPAFTDRAGLGTQLGQLSQAARGVGGYALLHAAPVDHPERDSLPWLGDAGEGLAWSKKLRDGWDPHQHLNRGRMAL